MLGQLYALAQREGLCEDPDFIRKRIDVRIRIDAKGRFVSSDLMSDKKSVFVLSVPRIPERTGTALRPGCTVDKAVWVIGAGPQAEANRRRLAFRERVRSIDARAVEPFLKFLEDDAEVRKALASREWTGEEWTAVAIEGTWVSNLPEVRAFWRAERAREQPGEIGRCLVTGALGPIHEGPHGSIQLPGTKGAKLVSFQEDSSCLPGVRQGLNAPCSREGMEGYVTGLNWLIAADTLAQRRHRQGISWGKRGSEHVLVYWMKEAHPMEDVVFDMLDSVKAMVNAPWRGKDWPKDTGVNPNAFYATLLGYNRTRVIVKSWIETTLTEMCENLDAYAEDLRYLDLQTPPIRALLRAGRPASRKSARQDDDPGLASKLFLAATQGGPFPRSLLPSTLSALHAKGGRKFMSARCALLKAILLRLPEGKVEVSVALDDACKKVPYLCGRALAVMEHQQYRAHERRVDSSMVDNYFRSASMMPAAYFPRLIALAKTHAAKILKRDRSDFYDRLLRSILDQLPAEPLPKMFSTQEQSLFAIGFDQQRAELFRNSKKGTR
jgi:CRISPR-associated protein Csd1